MLPAKLPPTCFLPRIVLVVVVLVLGCFPVLPAKLPPLASSPQIVLIVGPKLFIEPGTKAFFQLSSVSGPGL